LTLTNEETGEFLFFDVAFKATGSPPLQTYALNTVRPQPETLNPKPETRNPKP
jgi:hypothetical protein